MSRAATTATSTPPIKNRQYLRSGRCIQSLIESSKESGHSHPATGYGLPYLTRFSASPVFQLQNQLPFLGDFQPLASLKNLLRSLAVYACLRAESVENTCLIHRAIARVTIRNSPGPFRKKTVEGEDPWGSGCCTALQAWMRRTFRHTLALGTTAHLEKMCC